MEQSRRKFSRATVHMRGRLRAEGGATLSGTLDNVCLGGIYFHVPQPPAAGLRCEVWIELDGSDEEVVCRGRVVRAEAGGCAVELDEIVGLESFEHLQNLILYNAPEPDQVLREFGDRFGLVPKSTNPPPEGG